MKNGLGFAVFILKLARIYWVTGPIFNGTQIWVLSRASLSSKFLKSLHFTHTNGSTSGFFMKCKELEIWVILSSAMGLSSTFNKH